MYCPKCKDNFEEGSRRFCPTDGSRLVSEIAGSGGQQPGGIFANLIPKIDAIRDLDETNSREPRFVEPKRPTVPQNAVRENEALFELDDIDLTPTRPAFIAPPELRPIARKVQPFEIPAGHIDLGGPDRSQGFVAEVHLSNPERFIGKTVKGRYRIIEFLGGYETSLAYLADDRIAENKKVLVRILIENRDDKILSGILAEERIALSHFSHPNIAKLIDSGEFSNGTTFLVTEYIDALSVNDILTIHGQFTPARTARVIRQIASALTQVHQQGIVHRDLRPENLIIDASADEPEQLKLVNFGASNSEIEHNIGYKAPEVLDASTATVASDIFSLAVVAYEMLTGSMPFTGSNAKELLRSQHAGLSILPTSLKPELPRSVDSVLAKALAYNAADRYPKARDLGDALYDSLAVELAPTDVTITTSVLSLTAPANPTSIPMPSRAEPVPKPSDESLAANNLVPLEPFAAPIEPPRRVDSAPRRTRPPQPPAVESSRGKIFAGIGVAALLALLGYGLYSLLNNPIQPDLSTQSTQESVDAQIAPVVASTEIPPLPRNVPQPPNSNFYENTRQNLKGDLLRNFVGFTMYYPKDWKINGPQEAANGNARGKFIDISRPTSDGRMKEQMLVSYYSSKGTFNEDQGQFPQMVKETNETLKKILPGYQMVSEGEIKLNGEWRAYEIKFQAGGTSPSGEKLVVWGRRLFVPAARPGVHSGFEVTMLATSLADEIRNVDDVGVRGELATILDSFEPKQNF